MELAARKQKILSAIIESYINTGEPVGSKSIMQSNMLSCSSATIRNEMAELEELGYLVQPHTSAGRVPSEAGYRFYVDTLVEQYAKTTHEVAQINQLLRIKMDEIDQILDMASRLASSMTNYTGIAIKPKMSTVTMTKFEIISMDLNNFAIVMITSGGAVKTKKVKIDRAVSDSALKRLSDIFNERICGLGADMINLPIIMGIEEEMGDDAFLVNPAVKCIYEVMNDIDGGDMKLTGINHLLKYPEYSDNENLFELLGTLENQDTILDLVSDVDGDGINVLIGSESSVKVMNNSSLVYIPIRKNGRTVGVVGVIGPRRMNYKQVLKTLGDISGNISNIIGDEEMALTDKNTSGESDVTGG
jgi:heat-inducible transcriptional repressor